MQLGYAQVAALLAVIRGTAGSFEALASALAPRVLPKTVGRRDMDVKNPGLQLPSPAPTEADTGENILVLSGALQSLAAQAEQVNDPPVTTPWVDRLKLFVDVSEMDAKDEDGIVRKVKVVAPPLYGRWYAARAALLPTPPWFFQLNSDPRHRVPAALGTQVVQNEQQSLMESAWRQSPDSATPCPRLSSADRFDAGARFARGPPGRTGCGDRASGLRRTAPAIGRRRRRAAGWGRRRRRGWQGRRRCRGGRAWRVRGRWRWRRGARHRGRGPGHRRRQRRAIESRRGRCLAGWR
jgi:hypothetical protein